LLVTDAHSETRRAVHRRGRARRYRAWRARRRAKLSARGTLRKVLTRTGISLFVLVIVIAGVGLGYYNYRAQQIHHITVHNEVPVKGGTENILLIGSTSRCAASSIPVYSEQCQSGVTGVNSDVVLVAHLDTSTGKVSLLSIPRDAFVRVPARARHCAARPPRSRRAPAPTRSTRRSQKVPTNS
jgi:hypothetical protein